MEADERERLKQLSSDLEKLAREPDYRHLPVHAPIPLEALTVSLDRMQEAKRALSSAEHLVVRTDTEQYHVNLSETKTPSDYVVAPVAGVSKGEMQMALLVKKPDHLGQSMWEFRHGRTPVLAHIKDEVWLEQFRAGKEVIVPGSALVCDVAYEYSYDETGKLQDAKHDIVRVLKVIRQDVRQGTLFD